LLHECFTQRGIRDSVQMSTAFPMQRPVPVTGAVAQMFRDGLAERGIEELSQCLVTGIDPTTRTAQLGGGETLPYDLFVGIPVHRAPGVLAASGLTVNSWVPVDQSNLRTRFPGVYALGDVCTGPRTVPKPGSSRSLLRSRRRRYRCRHLGLGASGAVRMIRSQTDARLRRRLRRRDGPVTTQEVVTTAEAQVTPRRAHARTTWNERAPSARCSARPAISQQPALTYVQLPTA
jgi:hypothetical protein